MPRLKVPRAIRAMRFFVLPVLAVPTTRKCGASILRDGVVETRVNDDIRRHRRANTRDQARDTNPNTLFKFDTRFAGRK